MANGNGHNGRYTAQQFIDAIPGTAGIVTTIARRIGCDWHTARRYIDQYPTIKAAYDDECEKVLDAAESAVIQAITPKEGGEADIPTAKWYLTMKGAKRGYAPTERHEHSGTDGGPITLKVVYDEAPAQDGGGD